jgi:phage terminase small subunit
MADLTDKQKRFCEEYLIDLNGTQAAMRAGYSENTANEQASRLLANVSIQEYIQKRQNKLSEKLEINQEWVLKRFKEISDRCVQAEPVMVKVDGVLIESGEYKFDSSGANKATEMIAKHLGFFEKDNSQLKAEINVINLGSGKKPDESV